MQPCKASGGDVSTATCTRRERGLRGGPVEHRAAGPEPSRKGSMPPANPLLTPLPAAASHSPHPSAAETNAALCSTMQVPSPCPSCTPHLCPRPPSASPNPTASPYSTAHSRTRSTHSGLGIGPVSSQHPVHHETGAESQRPDRAIPVPAWHQPPPHDYRAGQRPIRHTAPLCRTEPCDMHPNPNPTQHHHCIPSRVFLAGRKVTHVTLCSCACSMQWWAVCCPHLQLRDADQVRPAQLPRLVHALLVVHVRLLVLHLDLRRGCAWERGVVEAGAVGKRSQRGWRHA